MSEIIYGIDLGTSNCLVARLFSVRNNTDIICLKDSEGNESFPSVIHFQNENSILIGENAHKMLSDYPERTKELIKVRLGKDKYIPIEFDGIKKEYSPQKLTGLILRHFNTIHNNEIKRAVLTVPANFDQNQKKATLESGQIADIEIVELIEEPSAAIMYHIFSNYKQGIVDYLNKDKPKNILVFDFGGGTLDLSLTEVKLDEKGNVNPKVLLTGGNNNLGGNIIDFVFTSVIIDILSEDYEDDSFIQELKYEYENYYSNYRASGELKFRSSCKKEVKQFILNLKKDLELVKMNLSTKESEILTFPGKYEDIEIDREGFEEIVLEEGGIAKEVELALLDFNEKNKEGYSIDEIILVGGTSQIPYFKKMIEEKFETLNGKIKESKDYQNAISKGAAILGAIINGYEVKPFGTNRCRSVVGYDIIIESGSEKINLVKAGTAFPFEEPIRKSFNIEHSLNKCINIRFKEDITISKEERLIKDISFYHPFFYTGEEIEIFFDIDEKGLFSFSATHSETNETIEFESEKIFELSDDEINEEINNNKKIKDVSLL